MKALNQTSFKTSMMTNHSLVSDSAAMSRIRRSPFHGSYTIHLLAVNVCVRVCFFVKHLCTFQPFTSIYTLLTVTSLYTTVLTTVRFLHGLVDKVAIMGYATVQNILFIACESKNKQTKAVLKHVCVHLVMQVWCISSLFIVASWPDKICTGNSMSQMSAC